jgi:hypothetical protein
MMNRTKASRAGVVAVVLCALAGSAAGAAPAPPGDAICPRAVPKIAAFAEAVATNDTAKIVVAARAAADAYQLCAADAQSTSNVAIEPTVNYDKTREAQYLVLVGRSLLASGNPDGITALKTARKLADDVADWQPSSIAFNETNHATHQMGAVADGSTTQRNSDRNGSRYRSVAVEIRNAADEALARTQATQPQPSTKPN